MKKSPTNPQGETVYFNTIQGWRINKAEQVPPISAIANEPKSQAKEDEPDDLPF